VQKRHEPAEATTGSTRVRPPQAAELTGLSERYLERLRREGGGPPFIKVARRTVLYEVRALEGWLAERVHHSTSEYRRGAA
jgi:hypothetical protein